MPISEIPESGYAYRVQPLDKDQASQEDQRKREKKKAEKRKRLKDGDKEIQSKGSSKRINLVV